MKQNIANIALVVNDYDEAIRYYTEKLSFRLLEDTSLSPEKRWVRVAPPGSDGTALLLAKAGNETQKTFCGNQAGGRVFLFLHTDDFWRDYYSMKEKGVDFIESPREEPYATVAIFKDLYGNKWDLLEMK